MDNGRIPEATVARLPGYLQVLRQAADAGAQTVSSLTLAKASGVNAAIVRKDLSHLGSHGIRGVGYHVGDLVEVISGTLGLTGDRAVVIVGIGNLGRALACYDGFGQRGFRIAALVDHDSRKVGEKIGGVEVEPMTALHRIVTDREVTIGVIATPTTAAQQVADALVGAGVSSILNFAAAHLTVPEAVTVRRVDLSTELQILSFYEQVRVGGSLAESSPAPPLAPRTGGASGAGVTPASTQPEDLAPVAAVRLGRRG